MAPVRIRDFPRVADLEAKLIGCSPQRDLPNDVESLVDELSMTLFGIKEIDTQFAEEELPGLPWFHNQWESRRDEHEEDYDSAYLTDDDAVAYLLALGLDFNDDRGQPLRCVMWLRRQAEAAAKGIKGKIPEPPVANEGKLEAEREAFLRSRKARPAA